MLNKLHYFKNGRMGCLSQARETVGQGFLEYARAQGMPVRLEPVLGGTLGITFLCQGLGEDPRFLKSHLPGQVFRNTLQKEAALLRAANGESLLLREHKVRLQGEPQLYLEMDVLSESVPLTPEEMGEQLLRLQRRLQNVSGPEGMATLEDLCRAAQTECLVLREAGFFSPRVCSRCLDLLEELDDGRETLPSCVCHGDLSDKNIMRNQRGDLVVIDWEDAFWGCPGYDYLYWLTFFNHRKYYSRQAFAVKDLSSRQSRAIVTMILILKSAISFYNGDYRSHRTSMEDRLLEIWKVWEDAE